MKNNCANERADLAEAFRALERAAGITWKLEHADGVDAIGTVSATGRDLRFGIEFKRHVRRSLLGRLHETLRQTSNRLGLPVMLCTDYADKGMAQALKDAGIQFVDKAGNGFLNQTGVFLFVTGLPKPAGTRVRERTGRAFQGAGLRLVFELLRNPQLAERPYRELAEFAGISLFAVKLAMDDLADKGFLAPQGNHRYLRQQKRLLDDWSVAYRDRLRPGLLRGKFMATNAEWWNDVKMGTFRACWGGEVAATRLGFLRHPQVHTVYHHGDINGLIAAARLHRDEGGNVEILDAFWREPAGDAAPDLLIYADLVTSGLERNMEAARELHAQRIESE
jgi:hypothetical protein